MPDNQEPDELVGAQADERLLDGDPALLPAALGRPDLLPASRARAPIVGVGAAMTGITLIGGIGLVIAGLVMGFADGLNLLNGLLIVIGLALAGTHWGWVHVAELTANTVDVRHAREVAGRRQAWLQAVAPHAYHEVFTEVEQDGTIAIVTVRYAPVATGPGRFTFERRELDRERHSAEEPAAEVTERAERLRREAALATEQELRRYLIAADRRQDEELLAEDERARLEAARAASLALSEQINAHLRQPPLEE